MVDAQDAQKRAIRAEIRERRQTITQSQRATWASTLTEHLIELVNSIGAKSVSCYLASNDEPDTGGFLVWAQHNGVKVLLPISRNDGLLDWAEHDGSTTTSELFNIAEPTGERLSPLAVNDVDLMLVPASAVDAQGNRLGWGRGYFDRTLGSMDARPPVFAVIFDAELLDSLPVDAHDQPVDGVVTPSRVVRFG
jgi:5-formyltetrahydrofolate cyclo-ligase